MNWETDEINPFTPMRVSLDERQREVLRHRFRMILADHGRVSMDDLDAAVDDLLRAVTA